MIQAVFWEISAWYSDEEKCLLWGGVVSEDFFSSFLLFFFSSFLLFFFSFQRVLGKRPYSLYFKGRMIQERIALLPHHLHIYHLQHPAGM